MKRLLATLSLLLVIVAPTYAQDDRAVDDARGAIDFIQRISDETIAVWSDAKMTEVERYNAFRAISRKQPILNFSPAACLGATTVLQAAHSVMLT